MKRFAASGLLLMVMLPLLAHHAFLAEFDNSQTITFQGTVTRVEWMNPHGYVFLDIVGTDGKTANWTFETASPSILRRLGLRRDSLKPGDPITVDAWVAKHGSNLASARILIWPDGRTMEVGDHWQAMRN